MSGKIPQAELDATYLRMCRHIAAVLIQAMSERDASFADMDGRLRVKRGHCRRALQRFIDGKAKQLRDMADLAFAIDCEIHFRLHLRHPAEPPVAAPDDASSDGAV